MEKSSSAYKKLQEKFTEQFLEEDVESPTGYTMKVGKTGEKVIKGYHKVEETVVGAYKKVEDKFVDTFLERE
ncbi:MAG: hypothetical protein ACK5MN_04680 [Lachnospiraceae bacterium]